MNKKLWLSIALLPWFILLLAAAPRREEALVFFLSGQASVQIGDQRRPVRLHDRLPADAVVEVGKSSLVAVDFGSGKRYVLHEHSRGRLGKGDFAEKRGKIEALKSGAPLLQPIAPGAQPGEGSAVLRIRNDKGGMGLAPRRATSFTAWDSPEFADIPVIVQ